MSNENELLARIDTLVSRARNAGHGSIAVSLEEATDIKYALRRSTLSDEAVERAARAIAEATGLGWDELPDRHPDDAKPIGPDTKSVYRIWACAALTTAFSPPEPAPSSPVPVEAVGWKLVPIDPTPEMRKAGMDDLGWWVEPYTAPRESGVAVDSDMSQEDADSINAMQMVVVGDLYRAMLSAAPAHMEKVE